MNGLFLSFLPPLSHPINDSWDLNTTVHSACIHCLTKIPVLNKLGCFTPVSIFVNMLERTFLRSSLFQRICSFSTGCPLIYSFKHEQYRSILAHFTGVSWTGIYSSTWCSGKHQQEVANAPHSPTSTSWYSLAGRQGWREKQWISCRRLNSQKPKMM